ncbi:zinc finger protein 667-like [Patiria miniata]|uniref:C2H2-type domain-containing protein n=1 Tax=Patiria miniata TaxID=46514 RepID=A0A914AUQ7_PATMI|nr:zinc finger protein 667-like [Patiria miniata]
MASQEDVQFRCKLCQYTALSKQEIADHFMDVHAAVEIVSVGSLQPAGSTSVETNEDAKQVASQDSSSTSTDASVSSEVKVKRTSFPLSACKRKLGFRSNALRSTISHLVRAAEQASKDEQSTNSGETPRGLRRIQQAGTSKDISKTVHVVGRELRKHKMKRKFEDFVLFDEDQEQKKQLKLSPTKTTTTEKQVSPGKKAGSGRQKVARRKSKKTTLAKEIERTNLKPAEFQQKMDEELKVWSDSWIEDHKSVTETCSNASCGLQLPAKELKLHERCHMQSYYGFKCPHCEYMHSRWRNMRCHIYSDHYENEKPLLHCDWPDCTGSFTLLWGLKRHVLRDHIRPKLVKMHALKQEEASPAEMGETEPTTEDKAELESKEESDDHIIVKASTRRRRSKGMEEIVEAGTAEEEAEKKVRNRKKIHRIAWLPSCSVCDAKNISIENMDAHIALHVVKDSDSVKCSECNIVVDDSSKLKAHMKEQHKRLLKVFRCEQCKYAGDRHYDYRKHLLTHADTKPCMCEVCGKLMSTPYNLKVHILRVHATDEQKTIHCEHCEYRFADKIVLKDHMRFQHNLLWNGDPYKDIQLRAFKCDKCDYIGKKEKSLKYHMRVHIENRQFRCSMCCYASKTKNNLLLHMRTHGGLKPIKCPQCDYRGATNKVVNEHMMCKHRGLRPYKCPCGWSTAYSGNMWKHMQEHREKGDAYKDIAESRYGSSRKKKQIEDDGAPEIQPSIEQQVVTIVHEFHDIQGTRTLSSDAQQHPDVVTFQEVPQTSGMDIPSSTISQVDSLPILGAQLQLNSLVQAVSAVAAGKVSEQSPASHQHTQDLQGQEDNQAANFLCKLAHAVSTQGAAHQESAKGVAEAKHLPLGCEVQVPTTNTGSVEQTIQELILW